MPTFRNPKYIRSDNSLIDLEINHSVYGWIPYTLDKNDTGSEFDCKALWDEVIAGSVTAYTAPSNSVLYANLRSTRDKLLLDSDWTQVGDLVSSGAMTSDKLTEWKTYRQSLRDLPANTSDPSNVTWPTKPT
jgi:hypothetical protein